MRKWLLYSGLLMSVVLWVCSTAQAAQYQINFSSFFAENHPATVAMQHFKSELEALSNGKVEVRLYPGSGLGTEEDMLDHVRRGTVQVALVSSVLSRDEPRVISMEMPYIIQSWDQARRVYLGDGLNLLLGEYSLRTKVLIKGVFPQGFRQVSSRFPLRNFSDFQGWKLRVPSSEAFMRIFSAVGAVPVPIPFTELYQSMKQRIVDGQDTPYSNVRAGSYSSVQANILETGHAFSVAFVLVNGRFYNQLPKDLRAMFDSCMASAVNLSWNLTEDDEDASRRILRDEGVFFWKMDDAFKAKMQESMKSVHAWFYETIPGSAAFADYCKRMERIQ